MFKLLGWTYNWCKHRLLSEFTINIVVSFIDQKKFIYNLHKVLSYTIHKCHTPLDFKVSSYIMEHPLHQIQCFFLVSWVNRLTHKVNYFKSLLDYVIIYSHESSYTYKNGFHKKYTTQSSLFIKYKQRMESIFEWNMIKSSIKVLFFKKKKKNSI